MEPDQIRFCLLHEEGHMVEPQISIRFYGILVCILAVILFILVGTFVRNPLAVILAIVLVFFLLAVISRSFKWLLKKDEFNADIYSAFILRDHFSISHPSNVVRESLIALDNLMANLSFRYKFTFLVMGDYHPSDEERIQMVRTKVDS